MDGDVFDKVTSMLRLVADELQAPRNAPLLARANTEQVAWQRCQTFADLVDIDPDARFATTLPLRAPPDSATAGAAVFAMYQRYAAEIQAYLDEARPTIVGRPCQPRKENERDLFAAAG